MKTRDRIHVDPEKELLHIRHEDLAGPWPGRVHSLFVSPGVPAFSGGACLTKHVTTPDDDMKEYVSFHLTRAERYILIEFLRSLPDEHGNGGAR